MTQAGNLSLKPLLVSKDHALLKPVFELVREADSQIGYSYNAKISGFVDPEMLPPSADKALVYTGSVSLVIYSWASRQPGQGRESSSTNKNVLIVLDLSESYSDRKAQLFSSLGVLYECVSESSAFDLNLENQDQLLKQQHPSVLIKEQDTETEAFGLLSEACSKESLIFLPEVSAEDIFFPDFIASEMEFSLASFLRKTTFDGVVATLPPYSRPVAAVEVDGSVHDRPEKKKNDEKKYQICRIANFPLFRIDAREGFDGLSRGRALLMEVMRASVRTLAGRLDSFNTWEKYIQHELRRMSDPWKRSDLRVLIDKTMDDVQRLKTEVTRLKQPDPLAEMQDQDFADQAKMEEKWKEVQEKKSRLRKMQNIREELFFEPEGVPLHSLHLYSDETESARVGHGVEFSPCFKLRARYKGLGLKEEFKPEPIRLPLAMQLPDESQDAVGSATFAVVQNAWRDIFFSEFAHYFSTTKAKIEKNLDEKIRRLSRVH